MRIYDKMDFADNYRDVLINCLWGQESSPRGKRTKELRDVFVTVPGASPPLVLEGRTNQEYLAKEIAWYLSANENPDAVAAHAKMWDNCRNPDGTVNSNYGAALFNIHDVDWTSDGRWRTGGNTEWAWCIESLTRDPDSRQAVAVIHLPRHHWEGNKDLPCTLNVRWRIEDGGLITRAHMRSCDLWWGLPYDAAWFQVLHRAMHAALTKNGLHIGIGEVRIQLDSAHLYERHWKKAEELASTRILGHPLTLAHNLEDVKTQMETTQ